MRSHTSHAYRVLLASVAFSLLSGHAAAQSAGIGTASGTAASPTDASARLTELPLSPHARMSLAPHRSTHASPTSKGADIGCRQGTDGPIYASLVFNGDLIVAGSFTEAGAQSASNIAAWDGSLWHAVGSGLSGEVDALAEYNGQLIAGGRFTQAGDSVTPFIAAWDGTTWSTLEGGTNAAVRALCVQDSVLFVGGEFRQANGHAAAHIARWNGTHWDSCGAGVDSSVAALTLFRNKLIVGGEFQQAGGHSAFAIASWDGARWDSLGAGIQGCRGYMCTLAIVTALYPMDDTLFVGGGFSHAGGALANSVARWDGVAWQSMDNGLQFESSIGAANSFTRFAGSLIALGEIDLYFPSGYQDYFLDYPGLARWTGASWDSVGSGILGTVRRGNTATLYHGALVVGGSFWSAGGVACGNLATWDGTAWSATDALPDADDIGWSPTFGASGVVNAHVASVLPFRGDLIATGYFTLAGGQPASYIARWDGAQWHSLGDGLSAEGFCLAEYRGDLIVGGNFTRAGGVTVNGIARWDGTNWYALGIGLSRPANGFAVLQDTLFVAGEFFSAGGLTSWYAARWDGTQWLALPNLDLPAWCATVFNGSVFVGGAFASAGGVAANAIARWTGSAWEKLGQGLQGSGGGNEGTDVFSLLPYNGRLVAGGSFSLADGQPVSCVAAWDGAVWDSLGGGMTTPNAFDGWWVTSPNEVTALTEYNGDLIAGGQFTEAGTSCATNMARWNGVQWSGLGSGISTETPEAEGPYTLTTYAGDLIAGGTFTHAGQKLSYDIAAWNDSVATSVPRTHRGGDDTAPKALVLTQRTRAPGVLEFQMTLPANGNYSLRAFDVRGRNVAKIFTGACDVGRKSARWVPSREVAPGVYLLRLEGGGESVTTRVILLR